MGKKLVYFLITSVTAALCLGCGARVDGAVPKIHKTATFLQTNPSPTFAVPTATNTKPPEAPVSGSSLTFSQHGVTVTLTKLEITAAQSILYLTAQVDPAWGFTVGKYDSPPQDVFVYNMPVIRDETGHIYEAHEYKSGVGPGNYVDPKTGTGYVNGRFIFEPVTGSRLDIAIPLQLMTVRAGKPISLDVKSRSENQSIPIGDPLAFGLVALQVKTAEWNRAGNFQLTTDGSIQQGDLRPVCLYLYLDPSQPPVRYKGCGYDGNEVVDLTDTLTFEPLPDFSKPVEVGVAINIVFQEPFRFVWIR